MAKFLNYKGWQGSCDYSYKDKVYYGKVLGTNDLVNYQSYSLWTIEKEFKESVDLWLDEKDAL